MLIFNLYIIIIHFVECRRSMLYDFSIDFFIVANAKLLKAKHSHLLPLIINNTQPTNQQCCECAARLPLNRKEYLHASYSDTSNRSCSTAEWRMFHLCCGVKQVRVHGEYVRGQPQTGNVGDSSIEMSTKMQKGITSHATLAHWPWSRGVDRLRHTHTHWTGKMRSQK